MSINVMSHVWARYPLGGSKLLVMLALADWASEDGGRIYPSMATLAKKIRMSERQASRILKELHGTTAQPGEFLQNLTPDNQGGRRTTNRYRIRLETLTKCPTIGRETPTPGALNPDIAMSENHDIAMSDNPLYTLNDPLYPQRAGEPEKVYAARIGAARGKTQLALAHRIKGLKAFICSIEKIPFDTSNEMATALAELAALEGEPNQANLPLTESET